MSEADRRPPRQRAQISVDIEGVEIVVKGKWHDGEGNKHDLGFAKLPTWDQAELMLQGMAARLKALGKRKPDGH